MYLQTDLPNQLIHRNIDYPSPALNCTPSHTSTALSRADQQWRLLLFDANLHLNNHLSSMRTVSQQILNIDVDLGHTLDGLH